ncbi:hypothetical protein [Streptomyces sp. NPDC004135]
MAHRLRPEGLDFVETAPVRHVFTREMLVSPEAVHRALTEVPGWADWFPQVRTARAAGAGRDMPLAGGMRFRHARSGTP